MDVRPVGNVTLTSELHLANIPGPTEVILLGITTEVNFVQSEKAYQPILVTIFGNVKDDAFVHNL
jgi:hypothetical protein